MEKFKDVYFNVLNIIWEKNYKICIGVSYWLLGMCNNFGYVIMLSAAHDILKSSETPHLNITITTTTIQHNHTNHTNRYDCNEMSTGAILICDILPGLLLKLTAPFIIHRFKYLHRVIAVILLNYISFLIVALTPPHWKWLIFFGVMLVSVSSCLGEITFLSMSTLYPRTLSLGSWSSGTGGAGIVGSFSYAAITTAGVSPSSTILIMLIIPTLMSFSYILMPSVHFMATKQGDLSIEDENLCTNSVMEQVDDAQSVFSQPIDNVASLGNELLNKIKLLKPLLKYMIPLFIVYFSEYLINQGLFELLYFKNSFIKTHEGQYR
jgi:battenin